MLEIKTTGGVVEKATEQEIADAKAIIGRCGIGCEPASAATLALASVTSAEGSIDAASALSVVLSGATFATTSPDAAESASTKLGMLSGLVLALAATTRNVPAPPSLVTSSVQPIAEGSLITLTPPTGSVTTVGDSPAPQGFSPPLGGPTLSPPPQAQRARTATAEDVRRKLIEWARKDAGSMLGSSPDAAGGSRITDPCFGSAAMAPAKFSA